MLACDELSPLSTLNPLTGLLYMSDKHYQSAIMSGFVIISLVDYQIAKLVVVRAHIYSELTHTALSACVLLVMSNITENDLVDHQ